MMRPQTHSISELMNPWGYGWRVWLKALMQSSVFFQGDQVRKWQMQFAVGGQFHSLRWRRLAASERTVKLLNRLQLLSRRGKNQRKAAFCGALTTRTLTPTTQSWQCSFSTWGGMRIHIKPQQQSFWLSFSGCQYRGFKMNGRASRYSIPTNEHVHFQTFRAMDWTLIVPGWWIIIWSNSLRYLACLRASKPCRSTGGLLEEPACGFPHVEWIFVSCRWSPEMVVQDPGILPKMAKQFSLRIYDTLPRNNTHICYLLHDPFLLGHDNIFFRGVWFAVSFKEGNFWTEVSKWDPFWLIQTIQMYGNFELTNYLPITNKPYFIPPGRWARNIRWSTSLLHCP